MDEIGEKLKGLFSFGSKKFTGTGHKLGSQPSSKKVEQARSLNQASSASVDANQRAAAPSLRQPDVAKPSQTEVKQRMQMPATIGREQQVLGERSEGLEDPASRGDLEQPSCGPLLNTPMSKEAQLPFVSSPPSTEQLHMRECLALVSSSASAKQTLAALCKLLGNILAKPTEPRYRRIRLGNAKIQEVILNVNGAMEFLEDCGFEFEFPDSQQGAGLLDSEAVEGDAVLPDSKGFAALNLGWLELCDVMQMHGLPLEDPSSTLVGTLSSNPASNISNVSVVDSMSTSHYNLESQDLINTTVGSQQMISFVSAAKSPLNSAIHQQQLQQLQPQKLQPQQQAAAVASGRPAVAAAAAAATAPSPASTASQVPRDTQVILPVAPDTDVPDWFFERTSAELKALYFSMLKKRQQGEVLTTKAGRERMATAASSAPGVATNATLRVRFPEGVCLQGNFGASEPLIAVFEWVSGSLRDPSTQFELITPLRKPLPLHGCVRNADLIPSTVLNFRVIAGSQRQAPTGLPFLSDQLLQSTQASY